MSDTYKLELRGCSPDPLMSYLKALGVFRLVSEQKDSDARGWWNNDTFHLRSALDRDGLTDFFLNEYRPTPIVSPWNGGSGFYPKGSRTAREAIQAVDTAEYPHLDEYRKAINASRRILSGMGIVEKPSKSEKQAILANCRNLLSDVSVSWLDAAYVLTTSDPRYTPLLGTGGNDGNMDFSVNFIKNLIPALTGLEIGKTPSKRFDPDERRTGWLRMSIFDNDDTPLISSAVGQFNPGGVGGPNASVGFSGRSLLNPWDYVLMFEGALMFAGAAARRLSSQGSSKAIFPFTVDNSAAGYSTTSDIEYVTKSRRRDIRDKLPRGEFWAPLWDQPASLSELTHLLSEGRIQLGRRQVSNGTDFVRAIAGLGTERGISQFQRYGLFARNGRAILAVPIGQFHIRRNNDSASEHTDILFDLDEWLNRVRREASDYDNAPAKLRSILRQVDRAIVEFCQSGQPRDLQAVLIAAGNAERWVSKSSLSKDGQNSPKVNPLGNLSGNWAEYADDGLPEFRLARAIASIRGKWKEGEGVGPIRENLEPIKGLDWKDGSVSHIWKAGDPLFNMMSVLQRRCLEGRMKSLDHPPIASVYSASLEDIADFLNGDVDFQRISDLILPLSFIRDWNRPGRNDFQRDAPPFNLPNAYAVMKLTLLPDTFRCREFGEGVDIPMESRMLAMLRAGRVGEAYNIAYRRLKVSGLHPLFSSPGISDGSGAGHHLAAALLFPLDRRSYCTLANRVLRKPKDTDS